MSDLNHAETLVRDILLQEFEYCGYLDAEFTDDVTIDGRIDLDAAAKAVVDKLRAVYDLDI